MRNPSTLRVLVDEALASQGTTLADFIAEGQDNGKAIRSIASDLNLATGIPIAWRTLYRWADSLEAAS
jgi:hypothetical protein